MFILDSIKQLERYNHKNFIEIMDSNLYAFLECGGIKKSIHLYRKKKKY
jgi:hypothetical protein